MRLQSDQCSQGREDVEQAMGIDGGHVKRRSKATTRQRHQRLARPICPSCLQSLDVTRLCHFASAINNQSRRCLTLAVSAARYQPARPALRSDPLPASLATNRSRSAVTNRALTLGWLVRRHAASWRSNHGLPGSSASQAFLEGRPASALSMASIGSPAILSALLLSVRWATGCIAPPRCGDMRQLARRRLRGSGTSAAIRASAAARRGTRVGAVPRSTTPQRHVPQRHFGMGRR